LNGAGRGALAMCGRYTLISPPEAVRLVFGYTDRPNFPPRYNIAPTQPIAIVRQEGDARRFVLVRWGLIPPWVKDPKAFTLLINARAETIAEKPAFRAAFRRKRCLIPADGWYEWQKIGDKAKRPWHIRATGGGPIAFAGLWEHYMAPDGSEIETAAIVTVDANATLAGIHDRMPAVLAGDAAARWLDPIAEPKELLPLLGPAPEEAFEAIPVSARVGSVRNDDPGLVAPAGETLRAAPKRAGGQLDLF